MATEVGKLYYDLNIDDSKLKSTLDGDEKAVKSFSDKVGAYWQGSVDASKKFALAVGVASAAVVGFGITSVKAYEDSQNQQAQLAAALASTHGVAGLFIEDLNDQAKALQRVTRFSDEQINASQALLLTFTQVRGEVFQRATPAILDLSQALHEDLQSATIQVGKALNDPILGVTALRRVGIQMTAAETEMIKKFMEANDIAGAQGVILKELNTQFGNSALAAGQTFAGKLDILKNAFNDLQETVGKTIIDALMPLVSYFSKVVQHIQNAGGILPVLKKIFDDHKNTILILAGAIAGALVPAMVAFAGGLAVMLFALAPYMIVGGLLVVLIERLVQKFGGWHKVLHDIKPYIDDVKTAVKILFTGLSGGDATMTGAGKSWAKFGDTVMAVHDFLKNLGHDIAGALLTAWHLLGDAVKGLTPSLEALWGAIAHRLWPAIKHLWDSLNPALITTLKIVAIVIGITLYAAIWLAINALNLIISVISFLGEIIADVAGFMGKVLGFEIDLIVAGFKLVRDFLSGVWNWIKNNWPLLLDILFGPFGFVVGWVINNWHQIADTISGVFNAIKGAMAGAGGWLYNIGKELVQGYINGIKDMLGAVGNVASSLAKAVTDKVKGLLGIHSPSKAFHDIGKSVTQGFAQGINDTADVAMKAMGNLSASVVSPAINVAGDMKGGGSSATFGDTHIGQIVIQNQQDADYLLARLNRNTYLESIGVSPV